MKSEIWIRQELKRLRKGLVKTSEMMELCDQIIDLRYELLDITKTTEDLRIGKLFSKRAALYNQKHLLHTRIKTLEKILN